MEGHDQEMRFKQYKNEENRLNWQTAIQYFLQSWDSILKKKKKGEVS